MAAGVTHREHRRLLPGSARQRFIVAGACFPPIAYALCIWHYAVNAPFQDDWSVAPLVSNALHGRLTLTELWQQHSEARLVVPNLFYSGFGFINHLNLRSIVIFNACLFVATFILMLTLFRIYTKRPLTFLRVLSLGIVWFSLIGVDNALWAFQLAWYLALLLLFVMIHLLLVWPRNRKLALGLALLAAIAASLSMVQGFLLWPVGLVCLLWVWSRERKRYGEVAVWLMTALLTTQFYLHGYKSGVGCVPLGTDCSLGANASHPILLAKFFLTLVANAVPVRVYYRHLAFIQLRVGFVQLLGAALCIAAAFVIVRSLQERSDDKRVPLPLLLIVFALLFDLTIALGRTNEGISAAFQGRFTMPSLLLLVGIIAYACGHLPHPRAVRMHADSHGYAVVAFLVLGMLISYQGIVGTQYGLRVARVQRSAEVLNARTAVNLDLIPRVEQGCYASVYVWNRVIAPPAAILKLRRALVIPRQDHLIVFEPGTYRKYRAEGPPKPPRGCLAKIGVNVAP